MDWIEQSGRTWRRGTTGPTGERAGSAASVRDAKDPERVPPDILAKRKMLLQDETFARRLISAFVVVATARVA
jgi:hypothetical protein